MGADLSALCRGGGPGAVPSAAITCNKAEDRVLAVSGTQHPSKEPSPAPLPGASHAGVGRHLCPHVSPLPPSCHRHNVPNSAWLRTVPLSAALPWPHKPHRCQHSPISSQLPVDTGNISAPFWAQHYTQHFIHLYFQNCQRLRDAPITWCPLAPPEPHWVPPMPAQHPVPTIPIPCLGAFRVTPHITAAPPVCG